MSYLNGIPTKRQLMDYYPELKQADKHKQTCLKNRRKRKSKNK